ncbi:MAG: hypothetical protein JOY85_22550, partial [Acidobacteriaceae bacterium]|nr:hypothetical protein [Acidobacteriaceae bacterium]
MTRNVFLVFVTVGLFSSMSAWADSADSYHITTIDAPGAVQTYANGINNRGEIVGLFYVPSTGLNGHAFLLRDGVWSTYFLNPSGTQFNGINDEGKIVGLNDGGVLFEQHQGRLTKITKIAVPETTQTQPNGINDLGQIVGWTVIQNAYTYSFLFSHGKYSTFNYLGRAQGI